MINYPETLKTGFSWALFQLPAKTGNGITATKGWLLTHYQVQSQAGDTYYSYKLLVEIVLYSMGP